jgi:hypothetical protein
VADQTLRESTPISQFDRFCCRNRLPVDSNSDSVAMV